MGDIERRRLEIIRKLEQDGVLEMNKDLDLPMVCQKIAVISSATAAGYEDFVQQLKKNPYSYKFYLKLFPALMQGEQTERTIIQALEAIYEYEGFFDLVIIIRGGGSRSDLISFYNYNLAYYITQFPLPVIAGIGHEKDVSVVDLVSHTSLKTPTAVAEFLISRMSEFEQKLDESTEYIISYCKDLFENENNQIKDLGNLLVPVVQKRLHNEARRIDLNGQKISFLAKSIMEKRSQKFSDWESKLKTLSKSAVKWKSRELLQDRF